MFNRGWLRQSERGSPWLIRLIVWITRHIGRPAGRLLLYPISGYFLLFSGPARRASRRFLGRVLGRPPRPGELFHHYHTFAATILDRIFLLSGDHHHFAITITGEAALLEQLTKGKGCLLLGSHLGSFELLRGLATRHPDLPVKALMYKENAEKVDAVLNALNPGLAEMIIPVGEPDTLFRVRDALEAGELVGVLGDRVALDDKTVTCTLLGDEVELPAGPMLLAGLLQVPVVLFFGLYRGGNRYEVHFELLSEGFTLQRSEREAQVGHWTRRYAERLEHYVRDAPYNWFNFYDYWSEEERDAPH